MDDNGLDAEAPPKATPTKKTLGGRFARLGGSLVSSASKKVKSIRRVSANTEVKIACPIELQKPFLKNSSIHLHNIVMLIIVIPVYCSRTGQLAGLRMKKLKIWETANQVTVDHATVLFAKNQRKQMKR
jgi:hypothetical protein